MNKIEKKKLEEDWKKKKLFKITEVEINNCKLFKIELFKFNQLKN